ncbi:MAG: type II toxin-antitoxin system PemK/MazF family toxin [Spirochaetaceae bacterium]|jgi:mRNA interferase MazF|nr:type II toxin-antitoxin system PemK/MazF family toxin [Spirochaetaceae bacterium]
MKRGDFYLVPVAQRVDTKKQRVYVVVSRQGLLESTYSTVICAPVYSNTTGLHTEVPVGVDEGLKHDSYIRCDELVSILKSRLTNFVGRLSLQKTEQLNTALRTSLGI